MGGYVCESESEHSAGLAKHCGALLCLARMEDRGSYASRSPAARQRATRRAAALSASAAAAVTTGSPYLAIMTVSIQ